MTNKIKKQTEHKQENRRITQEANTRTKQSAEETDADELRTDRIRSTNL